MSTVSWPGQVTPGSFICYWSTIRMTHCAAVDKETSLKGWCCCLQFFGPEFIWKRLDGIRCFKKGILSPWHLYPSTQAFLSQHRWSLPLSGHSVTVWFDIFLSPPPCAHNFLLEGTAHGAYTWHIWHVFSVERYRKASLDHETERGWTLSWTKLCLQVVWSWGNYLRLHLVSYDTGITMYFITWWLQKWNEEVHVKHGAY